MSASRRSIVALATVPLVVLGLVACVPPEPAAAPDAPPTPTSTPLETDAASSVPETRVPASCDQLFASPEVSGGAAVTSDWPIATQAGNLVCLYEGSLGGYSSTLAVTVFVDPPIDDVNRAFGWSPPSAEDDAPVRCGAVFSTCSAQLASDRYVVNVDVYESRADEEQLTPAFAAWVAEVEALVTGWPAPPPAWEPPAEVVRWSWDCDEVVQRQNVVLDAVPFAVGDAAFAVIEDVTRVVWVTAATDTTQCYWPGEGSSVYVEIVPGGAWMHDAGIPLDGVPTAVDGALAAALASDEFGEQLTAYIGGSRVSVQVSPPGGSGIDGAAVARDVLTAIVAEFG